MLKIRSSQPMSPGMAFFFSRIFPLIFIGCGAMVLYFGWQDIQHAMASSNWPTAPGMIQSSSVEYHRSQKGSGTYGAKVLYSFTANDLAYNGGQVAFGDYSSGSPDHANSIVNRYPQGESVTVYYDPANPEFCVLEPGLKWQTWMLPIFGLVFFSAGIFMAVSIPKAIRKS